MALNRVRQHATQIAVPVAADTESGDPVLIGDALPGVCLVDEGEWTDGEATVQTDGSFNLTVTGAGDPGDIVYITSGGALTMTASGNTRFGYLLETKGSGDGVAEVKVGY